MKMRFRLASSLAFPLLFACAHNPRLVPAPTAVRAEDGGARGEVSGIEVTVDGKRWSGDPADLASVVTPLFVAINNQGPTEVRVRYRELTLTGPSGLQTAAIPPFRIQRPGTAPVPAFAPGFAARRFMLFRAYGPFYPALPVWGGPWDYNPWFYDQFYGTWEPSLPTRDMLQQALPEGVIEPGGSAAGFLYFHRLKDTGPVTFTAEIVDANTREALGSVQIPLLLQ